jgi:hypothetical protein
MKIHDSYDRGIKTVHAAVSDCFFAFQGLFIDGLQACVVCIYKRKGPHCEHS